ncbi:MAG: hypothetical protein B7Z66_04555 [Chromatiales bacterium 21-64-14]|nr:MAG: hypothetical protein B7Z66_04555 [Chromatiales bacterium 21-64-14]HQU14600.1 DedA family protein [Gammaproteobacteria bacterium]
MSLESLVTSYGYVAILLGTVLEGETILFLGGVLAHQGYLALPWVITAAFCGTLCADQTCYFVGLTKGGAVLERRPAWKAKSAQILERLRRHRILVSIGFRFLYGLRTVIPLAIGTSGIRPRQFVPWNILGTAIWAATISLLGYGIGGAVAGLTEGARRYGFLALAGAATLLALAWVRYRTLRTAGRDGAAGPGAAAE